MHSPGIVGGQQWAKAETLTHGIFLIYTIHLQDAIPYTPEKRQTGLSLACDCIAPATTMDCV